MKKQVLVTTFLMIAAASVLAQGSPSFTLAAHIPFDFVVRGDTLPAGDYTLQIPSPTPGPMMVHQSAGNKGEIVLQVPVSETWAGAAQVTFHRLGDSYYLIQVADRRSGVIRVQQGDRYREASKRASVQTVTVAAK